MVDFNNLNSQASNLKIIMQCIICPDHNNLLIIPKIEISGNNRLRNQRLINFALPPEYLSPRTLIFDEAVFISLSSSYESSTYVLAE